MRRPDGTPLMIDLTDARSEAGGVVWERQPCRALFYGLGPRTDATFDLRGKSLRAEVRSWSRPRVTAISSGAGTYHFDFTDAIATAYRVPRSITTSTYGPTPKESLKSTFARSPPDQWTVSAERFGAGPPCKASLLRMPRRDVRRDSPMFNLAAYNTAARGVAETRAAARLAGGARIAGHRGAQRLPQTTRYLLRQLHRRVAGSRLPDLASPALAGPGRPRRRAPRRRIPAGRRDVRRPIYEPGDKRSVYFPRGNWTNLETNELTEGPRPSPWKRVAPRLRAQRRHRAAG